MMNASKKGKEKERESERGKENEASLQNMKVNTRQ
jgi:hypothetical protein